MKLLLTSGGMKNQSMAKALQDLVLKPFSETNLAFIPTAGDIGSSDKSWLIEDYSEFKSLGFKNFDIVDIAALAPEQFLPRLESADVLVFGGGNVYFLLDWIERRGLNSVLADLLKTRVYVGISAGSIATAKTIRSSSKKADVPGQEHHEGDPGLGFVDFHIRPHMNSPKFPQWTEAGVTELAEQIQEPLYGLDDQSALKVVDGKVEIVSEGKILELNTG